jgi:hypothetical protein
MADFRAGRLAVSYCLIRTYRHIHTRRRRDTAIPLRNLQHASDGRFRLEPLVLGRTQEWGLLK